MAEDLALDLLTEGLYLLRIEWLGVSECDQHFVNVHFADTTADWGIIEGSDLDPVSEAVAYPYDKSEVPASLLGDQSKHEGHINLNGEIAQRTIGLQQIISDLSLLPHRRPEYFGNAVVEYGGQRNTERPVWALIEELTHVIWSSRFHG